MFLYVCLMIFIRFLYVGGDAGQQFQVPSVHMSSSKGRVGGSAPAAASASVLKKCGGEDAHRRKPLKNKIKHTQFTTRGSELRKTLAKIIKGYKNGIPIETICADLNFKKSAAWRYLTKTLSYPILKMRKKRPYSGQKNKCELRFKSKKYVRESHMTENAEAFLKTTLNIHNLEKEKLIYLTSSSGRKGFTCDFFDPNTNTVFELKQRVTTSSNKSLFGQILVYQATGHKIGVVVPDDVTTTESFRHILNVNEVTLYRLP